MNEVEGVIRRIKAVLVIIDDAATEIGGNYFSRQKCRFAMSICPSRSCRFQAAGREAMLAKLAELMFVEVMRNHIDGLPEDAKGWFAGLRDPQIGAALRLIHGRPTAPWTLDTLAREIGLSRSSLAERFTAYVQMPPMQYLARWRLQIAARLLETPSVSVAQAAAEVGYQSEAARVLAAVRLQLPWTTHPDRVHGGIFLPPGGSQDIR